MDKIFERYRKEIITGGGILLFLTVGLITMLLTDSGNDQSLNEPPSQNQTVQNPTDLPKTETPPQIPKQPEKILYVYVTGEIKNPGVYKLSEDARIFQLIDSAGGFTSKADRESLNLADFLADGMHIHVGAKLPPRVNRQPAARIPGLPAQNVVVQQPTQSAQSVSQQSRQSSGNSSSNSVKVDVNHADAKELERLTGIGPAIAKRIIEYRNAHGKFTKPDDLIKVKGIGPAKLEKMRSQILIR